VLRTALAVALGIGVLALPIGTTAGAASGHSGLTWSSLSPPTSPPGLVGAVAAYDGADSTIVMFGGRLADGQLSDQTWVWNGSSWSQPTVIGAGPAPRELASMAFDTSLDPPQLILFGGRGADGALLDDTWTWNGSSWNQVVTSTSPGPRAGAAMTTDGDGHLVLFGGYGTPTPPTATVPPPDPVTTTTTPPTTTPPPTTTTPTTTPPVVTTPTTAAAAPAATDDDVVLPRAPVMRAASAGTDLAVATPEVLDDTWVLTQSSDGTDEWHRVAATTHPPPATDASLATGPSGKTLLFGGTSREPGAGQSAAATGQTWIWNGRAWSHETVRHGPPPRQDATLVYDADAGATVLYGGYGPHGALGDTWLWAGSAWDRVSPRSPPSARSGAAVAYDAQARQLVTFGGASGSGAVLSSTEVLSTQVPTTLPTTPTTTAGTGGSTGRSTTSLVGGSRSGHPSSATTTEPGSTPGHRSGVIRTSTVARGAVVVLGGGGFSPGARITITFHSVAVTVGRSTADADGYFHAKVTVPPQAATGEHHFIATGMGPDGHLTALVTPIRVVALSVGRRTSTTTKVVLIAIAVAMPALAWLGLGVAGRRRRPAAGAT
jgi:hypothetical protein